MKVIDKYLARYSEAETASLRDFPDLTWDYCLIIPAYRESATFLQRLCTGHLATHACLLILVINQPDTVIDKTENVVLKQDALSRGELLWQNDNLSLVSLAGSNSAILIIDRFNRHPIPQKQGVGLVRKIAADCALNLMRRHHIRCHWLFCTDADTILPNDYFYAFHHDLQVAACIYPFTHHCQQDDIGLATKLYETSLNHYVSGLRRAGSPYAFHTIGSTLAINCHHYAQVRGFPKRSGGEDFYLLNKLAKTGAVTSLEKPDIVIEARSSNRVPFGTGPAVDTISKMSYPKKQFEVYDPAIFDRLGEWLAAIPDLWRATGALERLPAETLMALNNLGLAQTLAHCRQHSRDEQTFSRHMHTWFDGFMTLKFVHELQRTCYPSISFNVLFPDK